MRHKKPILTSIPTYLALKLDVYLKNNPPSFNYRLEYFYYLVYHITTLHAIFKDEEFITLNRKKLMSSIVSNIDGYIKILENGEFIISDKKYIANWKSKGYKLNRKYLYWMGTYEIPINSRLFNKIIKEQRNKRAHKNRLVPHLYEMYKKFMRTEINYSEAFGWIQNNVPTHKQIFYISTLNNINDKRFRFFKRNKTNNRLDTNITTLKKELRQFLIGNYVSIDLKNSQPFFLSVLLNSIANNPMVLLCSINDRFDIFKTFGNKAIKRILLIHQKQKKSNLVNLKKFNDAVINGNLYYDFISSYSENITRKQVKDIMFKVLFSQNEVYKKHKRFEPYKEEKKIFASVFPFVMECVKALKEKKHSLLAVFLQRLESYVFIDCIAKKLVEAGIVPLTIHDSFLIEEKEKEKATEIINDEFLRLFGIVPSFHVEINSNEMDLGNHKYKEKLTCHLKQELIDTGFYTPSIQRIA